MPLILWAAIVWAGGTAAGLSGVPVVGLTLACAALTVVLLAARRPVGEPALTLLAAAALSVGAALHTADGHCLNEAARAARWTVRLEAHATPGSFVRGTLVRRGCHVSVALAVRSGRADAGSVVEVERAEPSAGDRGLLLRDARVRLLAAPGPLDRWRNRAGRSLDTRFGADAPMVRALLIADRRGLAPELRERYADAGLAHLLSISGLHVAIVGGALVLLFRAARLGVSAAQWAAVACTALYVLAIGAPPPAARSATLFCAVTLARGLQRPVSPWGTYALGAVVPLVEPRTVLELGWQLSLAGYAAIIVSGRLARRRFPDAWHGWRRHLAREVVTGALTTLATAPIVAWHFGRLSLVAVVSNVAAGPVVSLLQPTLFAAMLVPGDPVAAFVADAARPLLRALDLVARTAAALPGAAIVVAPSRWAAVLGAGVAAAVLAAGWSRHWRPPLTAAVTGLALIAWAPDGAGARPVHVEVHLIDVGQGDAIALRSPRGRWVLVDAGRRWDAGDAGRATVIPHLRRRGGELALLVITHPHADHIGGAASVLRALRPRELRDAAFVEASPTYRHLLATAAAAGTRWQRVRPGETVDIDGLALDFLAPDSAWTVALADPNEASTVVRARFGAVRILLTGDAERREEEWLVTQHGASLAADVLKVGHHGSPTSTTPAFLDAVAPRVALVSVGHGNTYGHPGPDVMRRLLDAGATVLRTDQLGTVILRTDGRTIEVDAAGARWPLVVRPEAAPR